MNGANTAVEQREGENIFWRKRGSGKMGSGLIYRDIETRSCGSFRTLGNSAVAALESMRLIEHRQLSNECHDIQAT